MTDGRENLRGCQCHAEETARRTGWMPMKERASALPGARRGPTRAWRAHHEAVVEAKATDEHASRDENHILAGVAELGLRAAVGTGPTSEGHVMCLSNHQRGPC